MSLPDKKVTSSMSMWGVCIIALGLALQAIGNYMTTNTGIDIGEMLKMAKDIIPPVVEAIGALVAGYGYRRKLGER